MWEYAVTFFALFFTDVCYTYYLRAVADDRALAASAWAVVVYVIAGVAVINYTEDHWALIPALAGAYCGTLFGMWVKRRVNGV